MPKDRKKDSLKDFYWAVILLVWITLEIWLSYLALFGGGGAESQTNLLTVLISAGAGIFGVTLIVLLKFASYITQKEKTDKKWGWLGSIIHDPEDSVFPVEKKGFIWLRNPGIFILISLIISSLVGVFQTFQQSFFTALPQRALQQITEGSQALLSSIPVDQEVYIPLALSGMLLVWYAWMSRQKKITKTTENLLALTTVPVFYALSWLLVHNFAHSESTISQNFVFFFGYATGLVFVLFRSIILPVIMKITVNFYQYLSGAIQSNEIILTITISLVIVLVVITILIIVTQLKKKSKIGA